MADFIDWTGKSGSQYRYWFLADTSASGIQDQAGNYMFVKLTKSGWLPVYIGLATSLKSRIPTHEVWADAIRNGATRVMAHTQPNEALRDAEEVDLIGFWNPVCNTQHRSSPLASIGAWR